MKQDTGTFLESIQEARISDLLKGAGEKRYEASGVYLKDGYLHVIFDDRPRLLRIRPDWLNAGEEPDLLDLRGKGAGYEDITYQSSTDRWYCLVEAAETESGVYQPCIDEFDGSFAFMKRHWLPFPSTPATRVSKACRPCAVPGTSSCSVSAREMTAKAAAPVHARERDGSRSSSGSRTTGSIAERFGCHDRCDTRTTSALMSATAI